MKKKGLMFVVSAPSGTGKTTLCRAMLDIFPDLHFSVSYTTRRQRPGDENGKDYHFISPLEFQQMIDRGEFLEWAEIYGQRYGTSRAVLEKVLGEGQDVILDVDGQGARQIRSKNLPGVFIFLLPPSFAELERRLSDRRTEGKAAMEERLKRAKVEIADAHWYDYLIVNDELGKAREQMQAVIRAEHCRRERMAGVVEDFFPESGGKII
jgi:guanylate kinase